MIAYSKACNVVLEGGKADVTRNFTTCLALTTSGTADGSRLDDIVYASGGTVPLFRFQRR
jgi:hypothetical protein